MSLQTSELDGVVAPESELESSTFASPIGLITLQLSSVGELVGLSFGAAQPVHASSHAKPFPTSRSPAMVRVCDELEAYFSGELREFSCPLAPVGTPFQRLVWHELCRIPFGITRSYSEVAERIGNPRAMRAVGAANGRNPIAIIIPCHRVVGADGSLTGYAAGLETKAALLAFEQGVVQPNLPF